METMLNYIKVFIDNCISKYKGMRFIVGYCDINERFIVDVRPTIKYEHDKDYKYDEYLFQKEFDRKFEGFSVMFISNDEILKIENPLYDSGDAFVEKIELTKVPDIKISYSNGISDNYLLYNDSYSLAA